MLVPVLRQEYEVIRLWDFATIDELVGKHGAGARALITFGGHPPSQELLANFANVGLVAVAGAGFDGMDPGELKARGIALTSGAGSNASDVADFAIGLMISATRGIVSGDRFIRRGLWTELADGIRRRSIKERRVGIIGLGAIGTAIATRLVPFDCSIKWWGPRMKASAPWPRTSDLIELANVSDTLFVTAPLTKETRHLIGREVLDALGPEGYLINVARGELVDEEVLISALRTGNLGGAALDVQAEEPTPVAKWAEVPNLILTPHLGGYATASFDSAVNMLLGNLRCFFAGERLLTPVSTSVPARDTSC
jgi:lactate dehydrogenase-like 2-hydroxyacid dehydrogenase